MPLLYVFVFQVIGLELDPQKQQFLPQSIWKMKQFILEEQLEIICDEDGREFEEIVELEKEEFIQIMLRFHQANSSRKWGMVKNAEMEKSDLCFNTYNNNYNNNNNILLL